jgi:hypothetical protein
VRSTRSSLSVLALVPGLLAGCGGGSSIVGTGGGGGGNNPTTVTFTFKGAAPTAVAAKIGTGGFTAQTLSSGILTLSLPSGTTKFAVAFVCSPPQTIPTPFQYVIEADTADGTSFNDSCSSNQPIGQTGTLTGNVDASAISGVAGIEIAALNGQSFAFGGPFSTSNFSVSAPAGTDRVEIVAVADLYAHGFLVGQNVVAAKNFDNQPVPGALNGGNPVVLGAADQTTPQPITYSNVPSGFAPPTTLVAFGGVVGGFGLTTDASSTYPALPAAAVESGDYYSFYATTYSPTVAGQGVSSIVNSTGGPVSISFPTQWSYAGPVPSALPSFNIDYSGFSGTAGMVLDYASLNWSTTGVTPTSFYTFNVVATANYQKGATTLTIPDLSGLGGFLATPPSGTTISWSVGVEQSNHGLLQPATALDYTASNVFSSGSYVVP